MAIKFLSSQDIQAGSLTVSTISNLATASDFFLVSDGGLIKYRTAAQVSSDIGGGGGLTYFSEGNVTSPQEVSSLSALGVAADVYAAIVPKGTGGILASIPDGTAVGGNARGTYAVDLQTIRNNANQVASGVYSAIGGGNRNRNDANYGTVGGGFANALTGAGNSESATIVGGRGNVITYGYGAMIGGYINSSSHNATTTFGIGCSNGGPNGTICGGQYNTIASFSNNSSTILGGAYNQIIVNGYTSGYNTAKGFRSQAYTYAMHSASGGMFSATGDAQRIELFLRRLIVGTTVTKLTVDNTANTTTGIWKLMHTNGILRVVAEVGAVTTVADGGVVLGAVTGETLTFTMKVIGNIISLVGSVVSSNRQEDPTMSTSYFTIVANNTNKAIDFEWTPPSIGGPLSTYRVMAVIKALEIRY
jgi:hypothetical protein